MDNALLVGGDSANPSDISTLRVMTTNGGRLGINTAVNDVVNPYKTLDKTLVVVGDARIHEDLEVTGDLQVNDGDLTTTNNTFNFIPTNANILNWAGEGQILNLMDNTTVAQNLNIMNGSTSQTIQIGNAATSSNLRIHRNSVDAIVDIASVSDDVTSNCEITLGGGWGNFATFTKIGTRQTLIAGELEIGTGYAPGTSTARLFTQARTLDLFDGDQTNTVNFANNATTLTLGSTGGSSIIRNTLNVQASLIVESNIRLDGGLLAGIIEIERGRFNTTVVPHVVGSVENSNIDFYKYETTGKVIDTGGVAAWGSTAFLLAGGQIASIDNITGGNDANRISATYSFVNATGGTGEGATFTVLVRFDKTIDITIESPGSGYTNDDTLTITDVQLGGGGAVDLTFQVNGTNDAGTSYVLPISTPSTNDFKVGDLLLIDRGDSGSPDTVGIAPNQLTGLRDQAQSEIVRVAGLANVSNPSDPLGYRLIVTRGQEGTGTYTNHPDGCVIAKLVKQSNASFITGVDADNDGNVDIPEQGLDSTPGTVRIGVAEFGGSITTRDFIRLSATEFASVTSLINTAPQSLSVNDGGFPAAETFKVESTTGDTYIFGSIFAGNGFNKFTMDGNSGNTAIAGTLTTENTLTINGSTIEETEWFRITNGGTTNNPLRTTLEVDTATGDLTINGGNMNFYGTDGTTPRLTFVNSSGDFTVYGSFSALGTGTSTFGGDIDVAGDAIIRGGDLTVNKSDGNLNFEVNDNGSVTIAGITNYFTPSGAPKWKYSSDTVISGEVNRNYFINCTGTTMFLLPSSASMGDTIRIIDISGALTYNLSLVVRAFQNVTVQGELSNTGSTLLSGIAPDDYAGWSGGELVVQTPNAGFCLVYAGPSDPDGDPGVPNSLTGWYLMDV